VVERWGALAVVPPTGARLAGAGQWAHLELGWKLAEDGRRAAPEWASQELHWAGHWAARQMVVALLVKRKQAEAPKVQARPRAWVPD